jgi:hypothetical protein
MFNDDDDAFGNTRSYDLIGTWRTTQENMCNQCHMDLTLSN